MGIHILIIFLKLIGKEYNKKKSWIMEKIKISTHLINTFYFKI